MTFYSPRVRTYRALMTDRLGTDLGTRLRKWPSSRSESLSKLSIWRLKNFNLPAAIVKEKEPIPFPKMLDDVVLYLRRFIIDPKNCSCHRPSRHITCFQTFNILKIARYLFSEYTGRHNLLSRLSRCFSREKKTKQNKTKTGCSLLDSHSVLEDWASQLTFLIIHVPQMIVYDRWRRYEP